MLLGHQHPELCGLPDPLRQHAFEPQTFPIRGPGERFGRSPRECVASRCTPCCHASPVHLSKVRKRQTPLRSGVFFERARPIADPPMSQTGPLQPPRFSEERTWSLTAARPSPGAPPHPFQHAANSSGRAILLLSSRTTASKRRNSSTGTSRSAVTITRVISSHTACRNRTHGGVKRLCTAVSVTWTSRVAATELSIWMTQPAKDQRLQQIGSTELSLSLNTSCLASQHIGSFFQNVL
jgi:hypothetical protein